MSVCLLGLFAAGLVARAAAPTASGAFPYQTIIDRNAFHLNPAPPPAPDPATIKPPPPKISLAGIMTLFGTKRALMKVMEPGKPS